MRTSKIFHWRSWKTIQINFINFCLVTYTDKLFSFKSELNKIVFVDVKKKSMFALWARNWKYEKSSFLNFPLKMSEQKAKILMNFELQTKQKNSIYNWSYAVWRTAFGWIFSLNWTCIILKLENQSWKNI